MKALLAPLVLLVGLAGPAAAQDTPANRPSQARIDAAMALVKATNAGATFAALLDVIQPSQAAQIKREHPEASDETVAHVQAIVRRAIEAHQDDLLRMAAIGYARHFSVEELHTLADFYQSEIGKKYVAELPGIMKENAPAEIAFLRDAIAQEMAKAVAELRAKGEKI